ncbi:MAG: DUF2892 domain-containing protein [Moraxellaceae bacterium]|jgi:hypothetical protein|nr:DUF2892 domain-containing protein [Moraxellaceae bacterium]MBP9045437.1 DUF2892 domain-containing protein [Moraxellaceae bacterium]MCC6200557.1 DUF2892 domain-containing protein [Moraxellaceae bacterium]HQV40448.1 DUF2892 domain-containing protein [Moraxellaceae bacterium]HQX89234.1 DUF2892 domain-containing protein [Moraxellaceae bacterium]
MTVNSGLRLVAGFFTILSVVLGMYVNANFLFFTIFIGLNLMQSAFTGWCPAMFVLGKLGFKQEVTADGQSTCCK